MIKKFIKLLLYFLILITIGIVYLSYFGIETKRFNQLIRDEISESNKKIDIELKDVKIILNLANFTIGLKTEDSNILFSNKKIRLKKIKTDFSIASFLSKEFSINNIFIVTKENNLKDIVSLVRVYENTPQLLVFNQMIKGGTLIADINLNFNNKGKISSDYNIKGLVKNGKIRLLNEEIINNINLNFDIKEKQFLLKNSQIEFNEIKLLSKVININNEGKYFSFEGDVKTPESTVSSKLLSILFKNNFKDLSLDNITFSSINNFAFKINKKFKFSDINVKSNINLKKLIHNKKYVSLKNYIPTYNNSVELKDHTIELIFNKNQLSIEGKGKFFIDKKPDEIYYKIKSNKDDYDFNSKIYFNNNPLLIKIFDYTKKEKDNSILDLEGSYKKNKTLIFKNISFKESKNNFLISGLGLNENFKIDYIDQVNLDFLNDRKQQNKVSLKRNKKNYEISGKSFDCSIIIDEMFKSGSKSSVFDSINNFNSIVKLNIDKTYIDEVYYLNFLNGNIKFLKNNIVNLNLEANFSDNKRLTFTIKTNENSEKITTLFSEYAKPLVKKYKFIKGFEEGFLDFYSIKKNNISKSKLNIYDFKLKELPALTKILTLASLQGIADLLTGEGIRFNEFEMNFNNKNNLMTIDEIYAIGPAISILMKGYVEDDKLVSLRGTLVPATTLNKVIGSIPLLGDILVGKKVGEGVFGVSFKIKGPPKDLKTTINPIKTLTPRFITRTLEKIKKTN